ncbi:MAG: hypothetical protein RIS70_2533 [Planctomycetota bacterium]|jgi:pilus assembly protein CpaE
MKTFVLIGSENQEHGEIARDIVARAGFESTPQPVVTLDLVADRASQFRADAVVVFLTDHIEQGQRAIQTVKQVCNTHLLAVGPARDPQLILRTMQMGADEYLDESVWNHQLSEALVRFKARGQAHLRPQQPCKTIGILAPSGGSGSSTLAVNIAVALSQNHGSSLLLDLRLTAGDLAGMLDVHPAYSISDLCQRLDRLDQVMFEQLLVRHSSGVHLLAAPTDLKDAGHITSAVVRRALALARIRFPYVVMDIDHSYSELETEALWQSDLLVLVVRLDYTSVRNCRRVLSHLAELGIPSERIRLVANRYGESQQLTLDQAEVALGMKFRHQIPDDPGNVHLATNEGIPVVLRKPRARVSRSLSALAESLQETPAPTNNT